MKLADVMNLLDSNRNERGIANWQKLGPRTGGLKSFGIGLTQSRKLAKQIGRNRALARQLWKSDYYDAKVISLLIDDPQQITREQAETQVEQLQQGMLCHVFSSCDATLAKAPFVVELVDDWVKSDDPVRRQCGYGLLYEVSKSKKKSAPDDAYFRSWIDHIGTSFAEEKRSVSHMMGVALMGIGMRNPSLHEAALVVARDMGPIEIDSPSGRCEPFDVAKKLTHEVVLQRLGL